MLRLRVWEDGMKPVDRQKMCMNCDGRVPVEATTCPYCSVDLLTQQTEKSDPISRNQAIQDSLTSLYSPPYKGKKTVDLKPNVGERIERVAPIAHHGGTAALPGALPRGEEEGKVGKNVLFSIVALSLGSILFILGLLQIFFSDSGTLRLEWSTKYWFIYLFLALPLLYYGYRKADEN